ncbi:PAS domain-containing protein [Altererythrobacter soli]|uniref:histidine kinase n=1 Tax=Croceibacterium soli TaxID=1739690 RepID=A0A6I4UR25_9SPHN|nr:HWE histidine kinase domain-containing protein [Croceibacterium soli]MXP41078.1 PAS domain-containing protein [Croceibacterium soli]
MKDAAAEGPLAFLAGGGSLGEMILALDWSTSPLGDPEGWPAPLKSVVSLMLNSKFPMFVAWGDELGFLYNDAYAPILGAKHPAALGQRFEEIWAEIWPDLGPLVDRALDGEASWLDDLPLTMKRHGYDEDTWFTFSYSPIRDEQGHVRGLFCACTETTEKVRAVRTIKSERERLENLFAQAPGFMAMVSGPSHTFELVNEAYQRLIGDRTLVGLPVREALPELEGQGFFELLDNVYRTGEPFVGRQQPLLVRRTPDGPIEQAYLDFIYQPVRDSEGAVTGIFAEGYDVTEQSLSEERMATHARVLETLNQTGAALASELDLDKIVQRVTDAGVALTGAQFGAFFYNTVDQNGEALVLYSLTGADRAQFDQFGHPRATEVFKPTFDGTAIVRSDDITKDPRYGKNDPHFGMPRGHLPVRSYLAVPVQSRTEGVIGGLFFGHEKPGRFLDSHVELIRGIAAQAAIAFDNARLYREAQVEIEQRKKAEQRQSLLINELNHRVKNTLAIVQGLAQQSFKGKLPVEAAREAFDARLGALAAAHNLLTRKNWETALLSEIISDSVSATTGALSSRVTLEGSEVVLPPQTAVSLTMAVHELCTNAIKHGALSNDTGTIAVRWEVTPGVSGPRLYLEWKEAGGPPVAAPTRRGFGSRMIERGLAAELHGSVTLEFAPDGLRCTIDAPLPMAA